MDETMNEVITEETIEASDVIEPENDSIIPDSPFDFKPIGKTILTNAALMLATNLTVYYGGKMIGWTTQKIGDGVKKGVGYISEKHQEKKMLKKAKKDMAKLEESESNDLDNNETK